VLAERATPAGRELSREGPGRAERAGTPRIVVNALRLNFILSNWTKMFLRPEVIMKNLRHNAYSWKATAAAWSCIAIAAFLGISSLTAVAQEVAAGVSVASPGRLKLDGYRAAKWGMSPSQVKHALKLKVSSEESDTIWFNVNGKKQLKCGFFHGKFYSANYYIKGEESATDVEATLVKKYGDPTNRRESEVAYVGKMLTADWDDGSNAIWFMASGGLAKNVLYTNLKISRMASKEEGAAKKQREEKKKKNLEEGL